MKKFVVFFIMIFMVMFTCACDTEKAQILFNKQPFRQNSMLSGTNVFKSGERIYYLITLPHSVESKRLLIQVVKTGGKTLTGDPADRLGYDLVWGKHVKLKDEQIYYYTDYLVFYETGAYIMTVYSRDNPTKILTSSQFYVKN